MTALDDAQVIDVDPDITETTFEAFLREQQSPALSAARQVYDYCVQRQVSPAMLLGMFEHESQTGKAGTATQTHSWGNTRLPNFGIDYATPLVAGRSGEFPVFRDWIDGGISTVARLVEHAPYRGKTMVREIIRTWAPASDLNSPSAYATAVLARMAELRAREQEPGGGTMIAKPIVVDAPSPNCWLPDSSRRVEAIVWHITQGSDSLGWLRSPTSEVSANYLIARNGTIYELVEPYHGSAWGNGPIKEPNLANPIIAGWVNAGLNPNRRTVSIEHEGLSSNNHGGSLTAAQVAATIQLTAWLCQEFGVPADQFHVLGHYEVNDVDKHYCPGFSASEWAAWIGQVAALVAGQATPPAPAEEPGNPAAWHAVETDKWVLEPFLSYWKANGGLAEFGFPITGMYADGDLRVQYFERARLEVHPDGTITRGRVGAELAERLGLVA